MKRIFREVPVMKCLVLSLSLFLCFQSAQALDAQLFNSYIKDIRNNKLDAVEIYLEQSKNSAETYSGYTVIYLNNFQIFSNNNVGSMIGDSLLINVTEALSQYYLKALEIDPSDEVALQNLKALKANL